jgi:hypothetical protein
MGAAVKVYVLEIGAYDERYVAGVFTTPEAAMAGYPHGEWKHSTWACQGVERRNWVNEHGDDRADVSEFELK